MPDGLDIIPLRDVKASEADWILSLFAEAGGQIRPFAAPAPVLPGALYLYNSHHRMDLDAGFLGEVKKAGGCGLLHLGDEYYRGNVAHYAAFDYVIRMYPFSGSASAGVKTFPLGYTNNLGPPQRKPASERSLTWVFAGDAKADRVAMAKAFAGFGGGLLSLPRSYLGERGISRQAYLEAMADAMFAPSPAGNIIIETCRAYEALHFGAIPLLPARWSSDPYREVFGKHPLPTFTTWPAARAFAQKLSADKHATERLQTECLGWWDAYQVRLSRELAGHIAAGRSGAFRDVLARDFGGRAPSTIRRLADLAAQQSNAQIAGRARAGIQRMVAKLTGRKVAEAVWSIAEPPPPGRAEHAATPEGQSAR